jgi:hypothetical protein
MVPMVKLAALLYSALLAAGIGAGFARWRF